MSDSPTLPLPIIMSAKDMRTARRKLADDRRRAKDLDRAKLGPLLERGEALAIVARMSARGDQQTTSEARTVRELMRRHNLTSAMIRDEQRRQR